ncbi:PilZ domain-containing protein [Nitrosomonas sp. Nm51]|uniref:flagellar brake protein n=1 Tax=Nitrosomonas sp. Nm51 TaxID=133720 RepID=UPI0008D27DFB|nr:flagellar brake protein [Nitrosomonas sp. Nm51]SEQ99510.1 PilZ domain-containing protein [Nitrosomonas sp. Nm51]
MRLFETINDVEKPSITSKDSNSPAHNELTATDDSIFSFKDLQLKVNDKLQIQLASVAKKSYNPTGIAYYSTRLIGYYQNYGLMVSEPRSAKINEYPLFESDELFIFYFNGQTLFKFASYVEKIITLPFKYLHLSFPKHISGKQIRKSKRIGVNIEVTVNNNPSPAIITDISTTGAKIETNQEIGSFNAAVDLAFEISLHGYSTKLQLKGNVQSFNISHENAQNPLCYGIKFTSLQHNQKLLLQNLIYQKLINELY